MLNLTGKEWQPEQLREGAQSIAGCAFN